MSIDDVLKIKCIVPKYYKSIIYLSHSFKGDNRRDIIRKVSKYNIYLATQCAMSCEKDELLENELAENADIKTEDKEIANKINGYLALIELKKFNLVSRNIAKLKKVNSEDRNLILELINNIGEQDIIRFIDILAENGNKALLNAAITATYNRELEFTWKDNDEISKLYMKVRNVIKGYGFRILRFYIAFNIPRSLLPANIKPILDKNIRSNRYNLCLRIIEKYDLNINYSNYELCKLYLSRDKQSCVTNFAKVLRELTDNQKLELLTMAVNKKHNFYPFVISLIKSDEKIEEYLIKKNADSLVIKRVKTYRKKFNIICKEEILIQVLGESF